MKKEPTSEVSSATDPLDKEDQDALDRVTGSEHQGSAPVSPAAEGPQGSPAATPQSLMFAGHVSTLFNEFFLRRFGPDKGLSAPLLTAIQQDLALALDTYFPNVEAKPGMFAALAIGGHFFACQAQVQKDSATPSASSDKAGAEKPPSLNISSDENRES